MIPVFILSLFIINTFSSTLCDSLYDNRYFAEARECADNHLVHSNRTDSLKYLKLSALSNYLMEDYANAGKKFDAILGLDPHHSLDSMAIPPEIIALFEGRKNFITTQIVPSEQTNLLQYAPLGIGHLAKGKKRGWVYAGVATLGLSLNVGSYWIREWDKLPDGSYNHSDRAARYYSVQMISFYGVFIGSIIISIFDTILLNRN